MKQLTLFPSSSMFEEATSVRHLYQAWREVKANRGAPGIDGVSVWDYEANLKEELKSLSASLRSWSYKPSPVRRVEIPKPGSREKRKLGVPTVRDRVVQQSLKLVLEPLFEPYFSESSYGFRPGRGQETAITASEELVKSGKEWVVDIDLEKFFDRINQDRVIHLLKSKVKDGKVLKLVSMTMRSGVMEGGEVSATPEGTPQGSPLSPLLSNIVLDELDQELEKRGLSFCRYADDAKIYVGSRKAGERVMRSISTFIEKRLKLVVNQAKSKVGRAKEIVFLGFVITKDSISISKKSLKRAISKSKELIKRRSHVPLEAQIARCNMWYQGWSNYYKLTHYPSQLKTIEAHIRRRFRLQFTCNQKRRRHLVKRYLKQGVSKRTAYKCAYNNKGSWSLSASGAASVAWPNSWFKAQGLSTAVDKKLPHWRALSDWIKPL